ncbi:DinB family protein [Actinotalea sp. M2MS4P-6]|uniref:DinB family protein n=1 Tax=Actinotalea sp. M2MS4P-6 TaxID=2983762 RepID=UPI0021E4BDAA|nr:DinB family protein [Actinotalea sp. M2MS4P-6]MCV2393322.1 DinB family protein [Actinotalea sp. M2MS4P-6]
MSQDATVPPWEPPVAGTEAEHLFGALDRLRATFRWKADGLDAAALDTHVGASALTLGALLKHLALCEDDVSTNRLDGAPYPAVWRPYDPDVPNWEFVSAAADSPEELYAIWDGAVARSRARMAIAVADGGLDQEVHLSWPDGQHLSLRRLVCDLIEEYGRHTGHADLLREVVDGRVGEDPPDGWRPVSGPGLWW